MALAVVVAGIYGTSSYGSSCTNTTYATSIACFICTYGTSRCGGSCAYGSLVLGCVLDLLVSSRT